MLVLLARWSTAGRSIMGSCYKSYEAESFLPWKSTQASDARSSAEHAACLQQQLEEARAQCQEVQLLWEGSVNECAGLDAQLASEQQKVCWLGEYLEAMFSGCLQGPLSSPTLQVLSSQAAV